MQVIFHTGSPGEQFSTLQKLMSLKRKKFLEQGILLPKSAGVTDHYTTFFVGASQLGWHPNREARGLTDPEVLTDASANWLNDIGQEIVKHRPRALLLTMSDMFLWGDSPEALRSFVDQLSLFSDDIHAVLHLTPPEEMLCQHFIWQASYGRSEGLTKELAVSQSSKTWWEAAHSHRQDWLKQETDIRAAVRTPSPALDQDKMLRIWRDVFSPECVHLRQLPAAFTHDSLLAEFRAAFDLRARVGKVDPSFPINPVTWPGRQWLQRVLRMNQEVDHFERMMDIGHVPMRLRRQAIDSVPAPKADSPLTPAAFSSLVQGIETDDMFERMPPTEFIPLEPDNDFDPTPLLVGFEQAVRDRLSQVRARRKRRLSAAQARLKASAEVGIELTVDGAKLLTPKGREMLGALRNSRFAPSNEGMVAFDESEALPPLPVDPPAESTGTLIIACMKDEAPYILEWIAFHKSIGVDHFLIFTNDCSDGTDALLDRLAELGHVTHKNNDNWKGKSPQQAALNRAIKMDVVKRAKWLIHIDVDEFINIRFGRGTLAEVYAADPDMTNLAMTWRIFGNSGIDNIGDASVIRNFTQCAPSYAPKPHTLWGFKSVTKNVGLYSKLSCHRPNKPVEDTDVSPKWLNGSLRDITKDGHRNGAWRSSTGSIGYNMVQLNHYALRSRDSFIIKRKRGRALHTERSIGFNYWVRHDWNMNSDRTILRHVDRMEHEKTKLLSDSVTAELHEKGLAWHHARAVELDQEDEFRKLRSESKSANLTDLERVAYSLVADMES